MASAGYICACYVLLGGRALADPDPETIVIIDREIDRPTARDRDRALGDAPFVTIIHPDDHPATASVADAVGQTVGALTRSLGGLGAFESVSVRGAAPGHTQVLIDGVPLARIAQVTTDLGRFALASFGEVELYRGAVPVELGGAGVGGALNLVTKLGRGERGELATASIGAGSFGARHVRLHYGDAHAGGAVLSSTTLGYQGATGDYTYYDDNGTPLNPTDDSYKTRRNNAFDQFDGASRVGTSDGTVAGGLRLAYKHQGLPGSIAEPALDASLTTVDIVGDARAEHAIGAASERELGYVLVESQRLHDPLAELGLGAQQRAYLTLSGGATSVWHAPIAGDRATLGLELRGDRFRDDDARGMQPTVSGDRVGGAVLAAYDLALAPELVVTPAMRLDVLRTAPAPDVVGPDAFMAVPARWDVVPSPRVTARLAVNEDVAVKASGGWYVRLPTLLELFGDRGYVWGNPKLLPERGPTGEVGAVWAPAKALGAIDRVLVEADAFASRPRDTIAFVTTAGFVARAENIGQSQTYGGELVASLRVWRALSLTTSFTELQSAQISDDVNFAGKPLPREPGQILYARADVVRTIARRACSAWLDTSYQSESYLDNASLGVVPARVLVGAGLRAELAARVSLALAIENLFDVRVVQGIGGEPTALADVAGFPLPGRSFYVTMDWSYR
jgi:outer membrane receptor protein involved in Fe transport